MLDLGCGTGQLALPLAKYFEEVIGMNPEPEMVVETGAAAKCLSIKNVRWIIGGSEDLRSQMGEFRLVTMGCSFHWTDRDATLRTLAEMVVSAGVIVLVNDSGSKTEDWQKQSKQLFVVAWEKNAEHEAQHIRYQRNVMKNLLCNHHLNIEDLEI